MASTGLQQVAEFGLTRKLESELKDQVHFFIKTFNSVFFFIFFFIHKLKIINFY